MKTAGADGQTPRFGEGLAIRPRRGSARVKILVAVVFIVLLVCAADVVIKIANGISHVSSNARMTLLVRGQSLSNGAIIYKMSATGNRYYPGQDSESVGALRRGTSPEKYPNCQNAGSALLARCLFTDPNGAFPVSAYGTMEENTLGTVAGVPNTIIDFRDPPMAILYFPARLDTETGAMRFVVADNARYLNADNCPQDANKVLAERSVSSDEMFLIVTAGPSGKYFEPDSVVQEGRPHYVVIIGVLALAVITSLVIIVGFSRTKVPTVWLVSSVLLGSLTGAVVLAVLTAIRTIGQSSQSIEIGTHVSVVWLVVGAVTGGLVGYSISVIVYARRKEGQRRGH